VRTTRAASAVERLKSRSGEDGYTLIHLGDGRLALSLNGRRVSEPLDLDGLVQFANQIAKEPPKRVSKFEREFDEKIARSRAVDTAPENDPT
jgi:hypothetical protein